MRRTAGPLTPSENTRGGEFDLHAVAECFDRPDVLVVYMFGSIAAGSENPLSDLDLAYLGIDSEAEDAAFDEVYEALQRTVGEGRFDLVPLRCAPLHLQYQVATEGRRLACRDARAAERFEARAIVRYLDFKPYRNAYFSGGE